MQRKDYTPTKQSKLFSGNYNGRESVRGNGQLAIIREFQALKLQSRQLEIQNRQLASDVEKLRQEKHLQESKLLQKASYEEETMSQYQKEKNYQLEMLRIKNEEELNRLRRDYEVRIEDLQREARAREAANRETEQQNSYVECKVAELRKTLENLEMELLRYRESSSALTEQLTREEFANKKLEMLEEELQRQKSDMEGEIHILLDIEGEKSRAIATLEFQLQDSQASEKALQQKLAILTENFYNLEQHIAAMKDRLANADSQGQEIDKQLQSVEYLIAEKEQLIMEQQQRQSRLRQEIDSHREREKRRMLEVQHLMCENERAYRQLAATRHKLHEVSIEQSIDI